VKHPENKDKRNVMIALAGMIQVTQNMEPGPETQLIRISFSKGMIDVL
jgi:hypothetical protein